MEPIKIKILKRQWTGETDPTTPQKKRTRQQSEKENKSKKYSSPSSSSKKKSKILENSPVPSTRSNSKVSEKKGSDDELDSVFDDMLLHLHMENKSNKKSYSSPSSNVKERSKILENSQIPSTRSNSKISEKQNSSSDNELDSVFDEMLLHLHKSQIKLGKPNNSSPKDSSEKHNTSSLKKSKLETSSHLIENKVKKILLEEFEKSENTLKKEKKIPELEKGPEDLMLNYKRTPRKIKSIESFETPKKAESVDQPRRSSRKRSSSVVSEAGILELEKTPVQKKNNETPVRQRTPIRKSDRTPKNKSSSVKKYKVIEPMTPTSKVIEKLPTTPLEKARLSLHVSTIPECLPCREKEFENILTFLENKLWDCIGGCMYISGVPGTGKTATVTQVIKQLQESAKEGRVPEFKYIEINGMRLSNPRQAYVQLWQKLFDRNDKVTPERALRLLDEWFSKSDKQNTRKTTVLLVDELDLICTKKQDVVYNLLDWPTRTHSRLVVLTIANTMDMPERLFKGRVTSRMGLTRLTFMPYTHKQLEEIVLARLQGLNAFVTDAVRLVTRKVAAVSGDARRALDICRRATELPRPDETVKISHIEQAIKEMTNSNIVKIIRNCGEMEKLFLRSLSDVSSRSSIEEVDLREVIDQLYAVCVLEGICKPSISSVLSISNRLKCCRLIFSNQSSASILQRLTLNVTHDDIHYALRT